jgi:chemotaxis protein methyltransferase CheR
MSKYQRGGSVSAALKIPRIQTTTSLLDDADFNKIRSIFCTMTGNKLGPDKKSLVESRLRKRLLETGLEIDQYIKKIVSDEDESNEFVSSLTTHKTDWFRENVHFDFLKRHVGEEKKRGHAGDVMIWSAACSTGEEAYTALMTLLEAGHNRVRILGTDISLPCVTSAKKAAFSSTKVREQVRQDLVKKYFTKVDGDDNSTLLRFSPHFENHFKWREFNLMSSQLNSKVQFDYIFLRNVLIYFEPADCKKIVQRLSHYLRPGGHLIVGLSETVYQSETIGLKRVENSVYLKL